MRDRKCGFGHLPLQIGTFDSDAIPTFVTAAIDKGDSTSCTLLPPSVPLFTPTTSTIYQRFVAYRSDNRLSSPPTPTLTPTKMAATCTVTPIATEGDFADHISKLSSDCLAVIYFHAPWAEPCKQMGTILSTLASTYPATNPQRIAFLSLDAEEVSEVSENYDVTQVPLVVLQKNGQVVDSVTGTDASKVRNAVEQHAGRPATGGASLPPAQQVTRPPPSENAPAGQANGDAGLAKYAPGPSDPTTAPEQTGGEVDSAASKEELHARLGELVKAAPVMLFMKGTPSAPQCGFSRQTVSLLREKGVRYGFFNILADDEVRQGLKEFSEWPTFPQVYVGGELVGGLDIVSACD